LPSRARFSRFLVFTVVTVRTVAFSIYKYQYHMTVSVREASYGKTKQWPRASHPSQYQPAPWPDSDARITDWEATDTKLHSNNMNREDVFSLSSS
jgi:hypothetical protein